MPGQPTSERRGDLDALRAFAMLLGIALHASTSFYGSIWPVHDRHQSRLLPLLFAIIHGFRMPLFFLLSGFFTMLVFKRRGLRTLLRQRAERIALPLGLAAVTILPLCRWLEDRGIETGRHEAFVVAATDDDVAAIEALLATGTDVDTRDAIFRRPLLSWAALAGADGVAAALCKAGADVNAADPSGETPLHLAAFAGRDRIVELLLRHGADPRAESAGGAIPLESGLRSPSLVADYLRLVGLAEVDPASIAAGRPRVAELLVPATGRATGGGRGGAFFERLADRYWDWLASDRFLLDPSRPASFHLFDTNVLEHLWFLWYLCLLVVAFALAVTVGIEPRGRHHWWLLPTTCVCQVFMEPPHGQLYGPDVAFGILPPPHLIAYYGCFFFFGAAAYARDGTGTRLGTRWPVLLPLGLCVLFPAGIALLSNRPAGILLQPAYAWTMALGLIGLFHAVASRPRPFITWLADASYWMYLAHLPVVIALQILVRDWQMPGTLKFVLVLVAATAVLTESYRLFVRQTFVGRLLNGPRSSPTPNPGGVSVARRDG